MRPTLLMMFGLCLLAGCEQHREADTTGGGGADTLADHSLVDPRFEQVANWIAIEYTRYETAESAWARLAPVLCDPPVTDPYTGPVFSNADSGEHKRKLYRLYSKQSRFYPVSWTGLELGVQPVGQALVKESFVPDEMAEADDEVGTTVFDPRTAKHYTPGDPAGLFIMFKLDPATEGTDAGWVYATTTPDGLVTAAGRVESCVKCHIRSDQDRMLGLGR